jgi:two-component system capsular synthesis response regulator RcsB
VLNPGLKPLTIPGSQLVLRLVVVKRDRMAGEFIRHAASTTGLIGESVCCQTATAALQVLRGRASHLGIFGLTLSDMDGLDLISSVVAERLLSRVLVVSGRRDERVRHQLRRGHVDGFIDSENDDCSRLAEIVRHVANGGSYFSPSLVAAPPRSEGPSLCQLLTPHEMKVFAIVGNGCDDREAAAILGLSQHTVHGHRRRIMHKVGVQTRSGLMRVAIQRGLVRITPQGVLRPGFESQCMIEGTAPHTNIP